jgi:hypothetical protein
LGTGTAYINAAGRPSGCELLFNRTDAYNLPGSIRAYLASTGHSAVLSIDTGIVRTNGVTVNLTDLGGSARRGLVIIGRNPYTGAATREFIVNGGSTLTVDSINFNLFQGFNSLSTSTGVVPFTGLNSVGSLAGTGTLTVDATGTVSTSALTGIIIRGGSTNNYYTPSLTARQFYAFTAVINLAGTMAAGGISLTSGQNLIINQTAGLLTFGTLTLSIATSLTYNLSGGTLSTASGTSGFNARAIVWNLSGGTITATGTTTIGFTQINATNTTNFTSASSNISFVSTNLTGIVDYGSISGGGTLFFNSGGAVLFNRSISTPGGTISTLTTGGIRFTTPTLIDCVVAGTATGSFIISPSNYCRFSRANTTSTALIVQQYARADFYPASSGAGWNGSVTLNNGGQLGGNGTVASVFVSSNNGADGTSIFYDADFNLALPLTITGNLNVFDILRFTLLNLPYYPGSAITLLNYGSLTATPAATPVAGTVRSPTVTWGATSVTLSYATQVATAPAGTFTWSVSNALFTGSLDSYQRDGDRVEFTSSATATITSFVSPSKISVTDCAVTLSLGSDVYDTSGGFLANCKEGITVLGGILNMNTKRTKLLGPISITSGALNTFYRNAVYSVPSVTLNNQSYLTPEDATSENGVVFYLETGSLYLTGSDIIISL